MGVRMRFRTDHVFEAAARWRMTRRQCGCVGKKRCPRRREHDTPLAKPGDTWRLRWMATPQQRRRKQQGPIAGYAICCPKCKDVHFWDTATNCGSRTVVNGARRCAHTGVGSCWTWTGSAEDGTLTARPSLHCQASLGGCGWHGWLTNGELLGA